ncbi:MAG: hypothetical protein ACOCQG_01850 [Candidatus Nanoarchaeia archaeon]
MKTKNKLILLIFASIILMADIVLAVPASSLLPIIGPIIAKIILLAAGAFFLFMSTMSRYKYLLVGIAIALIILVGFLWWLW